MEIKGTVKQLLPEVTGTSSKGLWKKRDVIIETAESYPKSVCITFWSELCDKSNGFKIGQTITVHFNLESREYNGRWYTEVRAWKFATPRPPGP